MSSQTSELFCYSAAAILIRQFLGGAWNVDWRPKGDYSSACSKYNQHELKLIECIFRRFTVAISDRPGGVAELCRILADLGVSIKDMMHERAWIKDIYMVEVCK